LLFLLLYKEGLHLGAVDIVAELAQQNTAICTKLCFILVALREGVRGQISDLIVK